jgi:tetratricopeptide (TPR) repeat protein
LGRPWYNQAFAAKLARQGKTNMNGMVSCKSCMAYNSLDSAFCKKCGTTLAADDIQQAKDKLESVVADGFRIFNSGRTDEAMQMAEAAVSANPTSTAALSLKAMCHERLGQISEALECHERVLEIDPDSMIDKIKVNDLRNLVIARSSIAAVPDRRMALWSAAATIVLVLSIGIVVAKSGARSDGDKVASNIPVNNQARGSVGAPLDSGASNQGAQAPFNGAASGSSSGPGVVQPNTEQKNPAPERHNSADDVNLGHPDLSHGLPSPGNGGGPGSVPPVTISLDQATKDAINKNTVAQNNAAANKAVGGDQGGDPQPQPDNPAGHGQTKQDAPGVMEITVLSGPGKHGGDPNDPSTHPNGVEALLRTARSNYQIGKYSVAANSYERALRAGADPATGNQHLAQCYEKLGRNSEAVDAYNRSIAALQAELNSGRGDKDRLSAVLDSCKQAVKVLGG